MIDEELPIYPETEYLGDLGVRIVENIVCDELGMIFRRKEQKDIGIDAEIEIVNESRRGTGRLLALQIKCGDSFFKETTGDGYVFRFSKSAYNYWNNCSLPVIIVLCEPNTRIAYWSSVSLGSAIHLNNSYKIVIPFNQRFDVTSKYQLTDISNRKQDSDVAELALYKLLHEKYKDEIQIAPLMEEPRDFHGLSYVAKINNEIHMIGMLYDRYGIIKIEDLVRYKSLYEQNMKSMAWDIYDKDAKLLLFIISKSKAALELDDEVKEYIRHTKCIEVTRVIYNDDVFPDLTELDNNSDEIYMY